MATSTKAQPHCASTKTTSPYSAVRSTTSQQPSWSPSSAKASKAGKPHTGSSSEQKYLGVPGVHAQQQNAAKEAAVSKGAAAKQAVPRIKTNILTHAEHSAKQIATRQPAATAAKTEMTHVVNCEAGRTPQQGSKAVAGTAHQQLSPASNVEVKSITPAVESRPAVHVTSHQDVNAAQPNIDRYDHWRNTKCSNTALERITALVPHINNMYIAPTQIRCKEVLCFQQTAILGVDMLCALHSCTTVKHLRIQR